MTVARGGGLFLEGLEFRPRLDIFPGEGFAEAFAFFGFKQYYDLIAHGQQVDDLAFTLGGDHFFVAFWELFG